jgi:hypothetical protein
MSIVTTLRVLAGMFVLAAGAIVALRGESVLAIAVLGASHGALLWAAASALGYLNRITQAMEWVALMNTTRKEPPQPPIT